MTWACSPIYPRIMSDRGEHKNFAEYFACKAKLFGQSRIGIVNADDRYARKAAALGRCPIRSYGIKNPADYRAAGDIL